MDTTYWRRKQYSNGVRQTLKVERQVMWTLYQLFLLWLCTVSCCWKQNSSASPETRNPNFNCKVLNFGFYNKNVIRPVFNSWSWHILDIQIDVICAYTTCKHTGVFIDAWRDNSRVITRDKQEFATRGDMMEQRTTLACHGGMLEIKTDSATSLFFHRVYFIGFWIRRPSQVDHGCAMTLIENVYSFTKIFLPCYILSPI